MVPQFVTGCTVPHQTVTLHYPDGETTSDCDYNPYPEEEGDPPFPTPGAGIVHCCQWSGLAAGTYTVTWTPTGLPAGVDTSEISVTVHVGTPAYIYSIHVTLYTVVDDDYVCCPQWNLPIPKVVTLSGPVGTTLTYGTYPGLTPTDLPFTAWVGTVAVSGFCEVRKELHALGGIGDPVWVCVYYPDQSGTATVVWTCGGYPRFYLGKFDDSDTPPCADYPFYYPNTCTCGYGVTEAFFLSGTFYTGGGPGYFLDLPADREGCPLLFSFPFHTADCTPGRQVFGSSGTWTISP
jgi:hypothetical protein